MFKLNCTGYLICQSYGHCRRHLSAPFWIQESIYRKWNFQHVRWKGSDLNNRVDDCPFLFLPYSACFNTNIYAPCTVFCLASAQNTSNYNLLIHLFSGCLLAVLSGLLYGSSAVPVLYIMNHSLCRDSMFFGASAYGVVSGFNASFHSRMFNSNLAWMKTKKRIINYNSFQ